MRCVLSHALTPLSYADTLHEPDHSASPSLVGVPPPLPNPPKRPLPALCMFPCASTITVYGGVSVRSALLMRAPQRTFTPAKDSCTLVCASSASPCDPLRPWVYRSPRCLLVCLAGRPTLVFHNQCFPWFWASSQHLWQYVPIYFLIQTAFYLLRSSRPPRMSCLTTIRFAHCTSLPPSILHLSA